MSTPPLKLISHPLCPYVQRAVIALTEKNVPFERIDIDLAQKPDWFLAISPLGKTPVLLVGDRAVFESAVILEYLEETQPNPLHPVDALTRAEHRAWIEFGSAILADIAGLYNAADEAGLAAKLDSLTAKFSQLEKVLAEGPFFAGTQFSLVDAVFGPIFRYFDTFDELTGIGVFDQTPKVRAWREALRHRPSIKQAVSSDYGTRLRAFLAARPSALAARLRA